MSVPSFLPFYVLGGTILIIAAILMGIGRAVARARWPQEDRATAVRLSAVILIGWFAVSVALAWFEAYMGTLERFPTIQYGLLLPILLGVIVLWRSEFLSRLVEAVPQSWIVGVQLYRALGVIFLILYASGRLPGLFAWPAGAGDVAVGLLAPVVAMLYARNPTQNAGAVAAWNVFGIIDLVIAVTTGFLTSPSRFQLFAFEAPNELISVFPLVLVPVYLVPLSILLHIVSLLKLRRAHHAERAVEARLT